MSDTQWPRYEVFKQDTPKKVHQAVGTVHAPDPQVALLNARNVFVRRPKAVSLWVVPAGSILSFTAEELAANPDWHVESIPAGFPNQPYIICRKTSQRRSMTFVEYLCEIEATTPKQALHQAIAEYDDTPTYVWWAFPKTAITTSDDDQVDSWFTPALDKTYRQQSAYGFVSPRRKKG